MLELLAGGLISLAVFALIGLVTAELCRPLTRHNPLLAPAFAVIGIGLVCWLQFLASWFNPEVGRYFAFAVVAAAVVLGGYLRIWRTMAAHPGILTLGAGLLAVYLGFTFLWAVPDLDPFSLSALRFSYGTEPYPIDNAIPFFIANKIQEGAGTHAFLIDWNGSDRPPLQSGGIIIAQTVFGGLGLGGYVLPYVAGVVLQLAWLPALWALLRVLSLSRWIAALTVVFVGSTATILINSVYTWPKLLSAALVLSCFAVLVAVIRRTFPLATGLPIAALAYTLAMLSHGAAAFTLPAVIVLAVLALVRRTGWLRAGAVSAGVVLVAYVPWLAYQRFYDPPGDRLLKWHLAGAIALDDRSFARALLDSYSSVSLPDLVWSKIANLGVVFDPFLHGSALTNPDVVLDPGLAQGSIGVHRFNEYYSTAAALSLSALLLVAIVVWVVVSLLRRRPIRQRSLLAVMALMLPCILVWCLALFLPGATVVHQGSHVWIVLLIAGSFAWFATLRPWVGVSLIVLQAAVTAWFYTPFFDHPDLRISALAVALAGIAVVVIGLLLVRRRDRGSALVEDLLAGNLEGEVLGRDRQVG